MRETITKDQLIKRIRNNNDQLEILLNLEENIIQLNPTRYEQMVDLCIANKTAYNKMLLKSI